MIVGAPFTEELPWMTTTFGVETAMFMVRIVPAAEGTQLWVILLDELRNPERQPIMMRALKGRGPTERRAEARQWVSQRPGLISWGSTYADCLIYVISSSKAREELDIERFELDVITIG